MSWNEVLAIPSFIIALVALLSVVYAVAYWRAKVDKQLQDYYKANILDRLVKSETMLEMLWKLFSEQVLSNRPNLASRGSKFQLEEDGRKAVEDVKALIDQFTNPGMEIKAEMVLLDLPRQIGIEKLRRVAVKHSMTLGELLAIVSIELGIDIGEEH